MKGVICNESPEERTERFMLLVEAEERRRLKEEYEAERRNDDRYGKKNIRKYLTLHRRKSTYGMLDRYIGNNACSGNHHKRNKPRRRHIRNAIP